VTAPDASLYIRAASVVDVSSTSRMLLSQSLMMRYSCRLDHAVGNVQRIRDLAALRAPEPKDADGLQCTGILDHGKGAHRKRMGKGRSCRFKRQGERVTNGKQHYCGVNSRTLRHAFSTYVAARCCENISFPTEPPLVQPITRVERASCCSAESP
jgi:hypothetical protein